MSEKIYDENKHHILTKKFKFQTEGICFCDDGILVNTIGDITVLSNELEIIPHPITDNIKSSIGRISYIDANNQVYITAFDGVCFYVYNFDTEKFTEINFRNNDVRICALTHNDVENQLIFTTCDGYTNFMDKTTGIIRHRIKFNENCTKFIGVKQNKLLLAEAYK